MSVKSYIYFRGEVRAPVPDDKNIKDENVITIRVGDGIAWFKIYNKLNQLNDPIRIDLTENACNVFFSFTRISTGSAHPLARKINGMYDELVNLDPSALSKLERLGTIYFELQQDIFNQLICFDNVMVKNSASRQKPTVQLDE